jgi:5-formyltetrahydrofolate cyclo-ligase
MMPECLGVYWPLPGEFDVPAWLGESPLPGVSLALPFAQRDPVQMHYRAWDGSVPSLRDECGIPSVGGQGVVPDVVLVPCLGFTRSGFRLGFGAGYFDRWLAAQPQVTAVGVAWSVSELSDEVWQPQPHDQALMVIVTEHGVVAD